MEGLSHMEGLLQFYSDCRLPVLDLLFPAFPEHPVEVESQMSHQFDILVEQPSWPGRAVSCTVAFLVELVQ